MHQIAEYILTNVSPKFTRCYPDRSPDLEQGNTETVLGYAPACFFAYFTRRVIIG